MPKLNLVIGMVQQFFHPSLRDISHVCLALQQQTQCSLTRVVWCLSSTGLSLVYGVSLVLSEIPMTE